MSREESHVVCCVFNRWNISSDALLQTSAFYNSSDLGLKSFLFQIAKCRSDNNFLKEWLQIFSVVFLVRPDWKIPEICSHRHPGVRKKFAAGCVSGCRQRFFEALVMILFQNHCRQRFLGCRRLPGSQISRTPRHLAQVLLRLYSHLAHMSMNCTHTWFYDFHVESTNTLQFHILLYVFRLYDEYPYLRLRFVVSAPQIGIGKSTVSAPRLIDLCSGSG